MVESKGSKRRGSLNHDFILQWYAPDLIICIRNICIWRLSFSLEIYKGWENFSFISLINSRYIPTLFNFMFRFTYSTLLSKIGKVGIFLKANRMYLKIQFQKSGFQTYMTNIWYSGKIIRLGIRRLRSWSCWLSFLSLWSWWRYWLLWDSVSLSGRVGNNTGHLSHRRLWGSNKINRKWHCLRNDSINPLYYSVGLELQS